MKTYYSAQDLPVIRKYFGINQEQMARIAGVTQAYISMIERQYVPLTHTLRDRLSARLNITPELLAEIKREQVVREEKIQHYLIN
ncbi:helix-turn-helix domain-containing protein [Rummeliibacillus pycnus]|uniref:helix-turn-helix domain-containing protein n=1 Tax=Rummeliibacillus pycnus TaxID=101070 RepID=UPI000C9AE03A|nr:helix-turn-helix transcriptional regulator [Rummeliibacillus pycnus]